MMITYNHVYMIIIYNIILNNLNLSKAVEENK